MLSVVVAPKTFIDVTDKSLLQAGTKIKPTKHFGIRSVNSLSEQT